MMAWLAVNKDGTELVTPGKPVRGWCSQWDFLEEISIEGEQGYMYMEIALPEGSVYKLTDKELTWDDEPIELT